MANQVSEALAEIRKELNLIARTAMPARRDAPGTVRMFKNVAAKALDLMDSLEAANIYIGAGRNGWEFAYKGDDFTPGAKSRPALLLTLKADR